MTVVGQRASGKASARGVGPLLVSTLVSVSGDGAFIAAAPLLAAFLTTDPLSVSFVTAATYVPWLLVGLPAGALVDRWPRRRVMVVADIARAIILALLCSLVVIGHATIALLVLAILLVGTLQCFFDSAAQAVIPSIVGRDKERLAHVNGRFWALDGVGRSFLGPLGGAATFAVGRVIPFLSDAVSFLFSAALVSRLPNSPAPSGPHSSLWSSVRAGLRHLLRTRQLLVLACSMGAYNFAYNISIATFVLYAKQQLHVADAGYGALLATMAIGGLIAGWKAAPLVRRHAARRVMATAHFVQALAWLGAVTTGNAWFVGFCFACLGAGSSVSTVAVASARQLLAPDDLLGRVVAAFRILGLGAAGLGALVGGALARAYGLHTPMWAAAAVLTVAGLLTWSRASSDSY